MTDRAAEEDEVEITPQMIEAGLRVFYASGLVDGPSAEDKCIVAEIFQAMLAQVHRDVGQV